MGIEDETIEGKAQRSIGSKEAMVIQLLGQVFSIPSNIFSVLIIFVLVTGVTISGWLVLTNEEGFETAVEALSGETRVAGRNDDSSKVGEKVIVNLWTPSIETQDYIVDYLSNLTVLTKAEEKLKKRANSKYYYVESSNMIVEFGKKLQEIGAEGFNRWKVYGAGSTPLKPGWMWSVTFPGDSKIARNEITNLYSNIFKRESGMYIDIEYPVKKNK